MREKDLDLDSDTLEKPTQNIVAPDYKLLAVTWLDDFEKQSFHGKTLDELLNGRNRV